MACNTKQGPAAAIELLEFVTDERVSQADWHALRQAAADDGFSIKRGTIGDEEAELAFDRFADSLKADMEAHHGGPAYEKHMNKAVKSARKDFVDAPNSHGTASVLLYLSEYGAEDTLNRIRAVREGYWEPEVEWLAGKPEEELERRLAEVRATQKRLKDDERDFGFLDTRRFQKLEQREDATLDAQHRVTKGSPLPGRHSL